MKKILLLTISLVCLCATANAQWKVSTIKGDALKGTTDAIAYEYGGHNYFVCWDNNYSLKIGCTSGIFNPRASSLNRNVDVTIGLYEGDTLVEKLKVGFWLNDELDAAYGLTKSVNKKIIKHLKTKGDVRIIAQKYRGADYDLTLPMNPDIRYNETK